MKRFNVAQNNTSLAPGLDIPAGYFYGSLVGSHQEIITYIINPAWILGDTITHIVCFHPHTQRFSRLRYNNKPGSHYALVQDYVLGVLRRHPELLTQALNTPHITQQTYNCQCVQPQDRKPQRYIYRATGRTHTHTMTETLQYREITEQAYWQHNGPASMVANAARYD